MRISGTTQLLGLIGDPVAHSLSPTMHNAALQALGLDYSYVPFPVVGDHLRAALEGLHAVGVRGCNVTIPHKQAVLNSLIEISSTAQAVGAVNTLYPVGSGLGWGGTNTDVDGFLSPLRTAVARGDLSPTTAVILGSGGAARAVIQGCQILGFSNIHVVGRSWERLSTLQGLPIHTHLWSELRSVLPQADLVVNTTPIGMAGQGSDHESPLSSSDIDALPPQSWVYDLIYIPNPTVLLRQANAAGYRTLDGLEMLVQQGAASLSLWLGGIEVPVETMRLAARQALGWD